MWPVHRLVSGSPQDRKIDFWSVMSAPGHPPLWIRGGAVTWGRLRTPVRTQGPQTRRGIVLGQAKGPGGSSRPSPPFHNLQSRLGVNNLGFLLRPLYGGPTSQVGLPFLHSAMSTLLPSVQFVVLGECVVCVCVCACECVSCEVFEAGVRMYRSLCGGGCACYYMC